MSEAESSGTNQSALQTFDAEGVRLLAPELLFSLVGRVAVVTGAAGGIGRWLAAGLGSAGAQVVVTDRDQIGLEAVTRTLEDAGIEAAAVVVDLGDEDAPERVVEGALERFGRLDVLVNNAGLARRMPILDMDGQTWDDITRLILRVPYFLSQRAARVMIEQGGGSIINISSIAASYGQENNSVYGAAKAGLSQLTRVMALEWTKYGIRANAIAPGYTDTPIATFLWENRDIYRWMLNRVPMERLGRPTELVGACLLLASEAGSFVNGQILHVDGGALAGGRMHTPDR
jgi:NAD(P)-dependent dehydrogenase (short-subunit alcohol dehydrogenase family)